MLQKPITKLLFALTILLISLSSRAQMDTLSASPNPFTDSTVFSIQYLNGDTVTLQVFNNVGQVVATLLDSVVLSGTVPVSFHADTLPDGVYFANLSINHKQYPIRVIKTQNTTGLAYITQESIRIYPNPTSGSISISSAIAIEQIAIYNLEGKLLQTLYESNKSIDLSKLASGTYFLHIKTEGHTYVEKVIRK